MRERRAFVIDTKWKGALAQLELSWKGKGEIELRIPFMTPEPFTILLQEVTDAIEAIRDIHHNA